LVISAYNGSTYLGSSPVIFGPATARFNI
jgi:hypothetical protein